MDQPFTNERFIGGPNIAKCFKWSRNSSQDEGLFRNFEGTHRISIILQKGNTSYHGKLSEIYDSAELGRASGDCYRYALIAMGGLDAVIDMGLQSYDICAMIPIVESAEESLLTGMEIHVMMAAKFGLWRQAIAL